MSPSSNSVIITGRTRTSSERRSRDAEVIAKAISASRAWVLLIAFLFAIIVVVESSQPFQACVKEIYNPATENFEKSITSFSAAFDIHRDCFGNFTHDNAEAIIAAFTIILSFSTIFLWAATRDLVSGAEQTAKRQLRAYVFIHEGVIKLMNNDTAIMAEVTLRNFGATPGYDFKSWTNIRIGNPGEPIFGQRKSPMQTSIIGPFSNISGPSQIIPITPDERSAINNGIKEIFVWGEATYKDAFGTSWTFAFKDISGGIEIVRTENSTGRLLWRGWGLSPAGYEEKKS